MKKPLWISLSVVFGILTAAVSIAHVAILPSFDSQLRSYFKPEVAKIVETGTGEENTTYFASEFLDAEGKRDLAKQQAEENELCANLEGEGATLLFNNNDTLPFAAQSKFSLFSTSSVDSIYGGTGSGQVSTNDAINLRKALNTEFGSGTVNTDLYRHYLQDLSGYRRVNAGTTGGKIEDYKINEAPWEQVMNAEMEETLPDYPNALVVLARSGGEGNDLPISECNDAINGNYLVLNQDEIDMLNGLKALKSAGKIKKIVVLLNSSNAIQLDFLFNETYGIDAAVWIGDVGTAGMTAVAELLSGKRNFSGRLSDTFLKDNLSAPSIVNFGLRAYTNSSAGSKEYSTSWVQYNKMNDSDKCNENYIVYQEGIYIGYRYYETRYADYVMGKGNTADYDYSKDVAYPFGYGLSYTDFSYSNFNMEEKGDVFEFSLRVTNTGKKAGKHSVEIYSSSEYTDYDKSNLIEKSAVQLAGFTKTNVIEPNAYEDVSLTVKKRDIATYDSKVSKTYILEGNYSFTVGKNAHDANNNILAANGYTERLDAQGDISLVKQWNPGKLDNETCSTSEETGYRITNAFDHADLNLYEGTSDQKITYVSRSDWKGTFPKEPVSLKITPKMWEDGLDYSSESRTANVQKMIDAHYADWKGLELPTMGAGQALSAVMFRDVEDLNDPLYDQLISQASYEEMTETIYTAFHITKEIPSLGLPDTKDENGPQGYTASLVQGGGDSVRGMAYTSEDVMAATRNVELLKRMGECIGEDCLAANNAGLYGPGANIHRNPYCGRNFEYYSEDPILSYKLQEKEVVGIQSKGVYVFTKHFALNDQESGRYGLSTWANEQSIRELYLKAFEGTALAGGSGFMTSFNRLGVIWAGSDYSLLTTVVRNEWGMKGALITDCSVFAGYMDPALGILAGQDIWDGNTNTRTLDKYANDPVVTRCVQRATKHLVYSISHSLAMNGISSTAKVIPIEPWWWPLTRYLAVGLGVLTGGCLVMVALSFRKKKE